MCELVMNTGLSWYSVRASIREQSEFFTFFFKFLSQFSVVSLCCISLLYISFSLGHPPVFNSVFISAHCTFLACVTGVHKDESVQCSTPQLVERNHIRLITLGHKLLLTALCVLLITAHFHTT